MELSAEEKSQFGKTNSMGDRHPNFSHGKFLLMLDEWKMFRSRQGSPTDIHNFVVVKSEVNPVKQGDKVLEEPPNAAWTRVGATYKWSPDDAGTMARQNSVKFMLALFGIKDADITEDKKLEMLLRCTNEDPNRFKDDKDEETGEISPSVNPCRGMVIAADTTPVFTKKEKWITVVNFIHVAPPGVGENRYDASAKRWKEFTERLKQAA